MEQSKRIENESGVKTKESKIRKEQDEITIRKEKAKIAMEIMQMEKEDLRSRRREELSHQEFFKKRLFNLPDSFNNPKE